MFAASLALLSCFGVWQTWRHNPLYSTRSAVWLLVKIVAMLAITAAAIYTAAVLTQNRSTAVQLTALLTTIAFCTIVMVIGISRAATPRIARLQSRLPPGTRVVFLYRRRIEKWAMAALIYFAVAGVLVLLPDPWQSFGAVMVMMGGLTWGVMLPIWYWMARRVDRAVTALEQRPWLHWQYPVQFRNAWCEEAVRRLGGESGRFVLRRDWLKFLGLCAVILVPLLLIEPLNWLERLVWGLICCALVVFFVALSTLEERHAPVRLATRMKLDPGDAWFGVDGLVCEGHFYRWLDPGVYLETADIDPRAPRSVRFVFFTMYSGAYGSATGGHITQNVPIPPDGRPEDLVLLQGYLRNRCPQADVTLV